MSAILAVLRCSIPRWLSEGLAIGVAFAAVDGPSAVKNIGCRTAQRGACLKPTDIAQPDYFHKVVDCQWACPAHTPVPEYIRLIAAGRYGDAYLVNWKSNVFPGILGRTCDRPCEPACRRGRVEEGGDQKAKPEPVAICRLKRVAADFKEDIRDACPSRRRKRTASASRSSAPDRRRSRSRAISRRSATSSSCSTAMRKAGGMMRTQIPKFRLPESVIDEEMGYVLDLGVDFRAGQRIDSMRALLGRGLRRGLRRQRRAARPRPRRPGPRGSRGEHPHRHRLAVERVVRPHHAHRQARHRARRRQHGDGLLPQRAPPGRRRREGGRALRLRRDEGVAVGEGGRAARGHPDPQLSWCRRRSRTTTASSPA